MRHSPLTRRVAFACALFCAACLRAPGAPVDNNPPPGWWRDATFYEIFVRSFADARSGSLAGDGIGDLQGLIDHLDYLNDGRGSDGHSLGITALWLMPIQPSPSYHGYDVTDYFAVNPQYGDIALMKHLVEEAHRRGIRIIVDFVLNHCSSNHPLFVDSISDDAARQQARGYFRFAPVPENVAGPWDQRVWHPAGDSFYYGVFGADMPDWNFRDPRVTEHHRKAAAFWLREVGVDGFRLDAVRYFYERGDALQDTEETEQWLRDFTAYCHEIKPGSFVVGENTADSGEIARYIHRGSLDSAFEFNVARATVEAIRLRAPGLLANTIGHAAQLNGGDTAWSTFLSNHDQERIATQLGDSPRTRLAAKLLFTLPGTPFIYYGEELGMTGRKPDPDLRTPMLWSDAANAGFTSEAARPWHTIAGNSKRESVAVETADPASLLSLYRTLVRLRERSPAIRHGHARDLAVDDRKIYAAFRETQNDAVLVLANFDDASRPCPTLSLPNSAVRSTWTAHEELESRALAKLTVDEHGGWTNWQPYPALASRALYVIRWTAPEPQ